MAETFTNALGRAVGVVTSTTTASIGANATLITGISTLGIGIGDLVDNSNFVGGTKVASIGSGQVTADRASTNTGSVSSQIINFVGLTTVYSSPAATKSILIGGTLSNNTGNQVAATVQISSGSTSYNLLYKVPVPAGSSVVISDAGKTLLQANDEIRVGAGTSNSLDVSLSILQGIS